MLIRTKGEEHTRRIGRLIGERLRGGEVIALYGDLGSGKTVLTQGIALGAGVPESVYVTSQTFTLLRTYPGRIKVHHVDLYRVEGPDEVEARGIVEVMGDPAGAAVIEWADRADMPAERLEVHLRHVSPDQRELELVPFGEAAERLVAEVAEAC